VANQSIVGFDIQVDTAGVINLLHLNMHFLRPGLQVADLFWNLLGPQESAFLNHR